MAQNITIMGASYSDVPAVQLPKIGGGTARFDDASITTATASDVASGKVFLAADGTITTGTSSGGGGVDMPTFTVTWDAKYMRILSITCDKTYSEVCDYIDAGKVVAIVRETAGKDTAEMVAYFRDFDHFPSNSIKYFVYINTHELSYDIIYNSSGTLTAISPSSYYETLNVTANGTYAPSTGYSVINTVNVNVPQPSGTKSISISANGTTTEDVTNYANAQITVAVPQPTGTITITSNGTHDVTNYANAVVNVEGSGGDSAWTKVAETSYQVSTTSTSTTTVATWATGDNSIWTSDKWVYVRIRDTAGKRADYFYGSDQFFIVTPNTSGTSTTAGSRFCIRYYPSGGYLASATSGATGYGVYADTLYSDGRIRVRARYSSNNSLTINGTYKVEVYLLDPAGGVPIFE